MDFPKCNEDPLIDPLNDCNRCTAVLVCLPMRHRKKVAEPVLDWFKGLTSISKGKSTFALPEALKELLIAPVRDGVLRELESRESEHAAIARKGKLFCAIRDIITDYKKANKATGIPTGFTVLFIAKHVFGRSSRQTLYTWKTIWETYGSDVRNLTDLTITKLDSLAKLEKDQRDEWLNERRSEVAQMDEDAFKVLVRKPVTKKPAPGKLINGYRVIRDPKGTYVRGLQESYAVEQEKLEDFLNTLTPGCETEENVSDASHDVGGASPAPVRPSVVAASPA